MHSNAPKEVLYKNLFDEMRGFWQDKKEVLNKNVLNKAMKEDLANKVEELQHHWPENFHLVQNQ